MSGKALILIGSPKPGRSTSLSIGEYLKTKLKGHGMEVLIENVGGSLKSENGPDDLLKLILDHDQIILIFPLYVDSLPWPMTRALEEIHARGDLDKMKGKGLSSIINCGFPEASQIETATSICEMFARRMGMRWMGGLMLGGGGAISGRKLDSMGAMVRNVRKSLDITAGSLSRGEEISADAKKLMEKKLAPYKIYTYLGNVGWKKQAKKNKIDLNATPYAK